MVGAMRAAYGGGVDELTRWALAARDGDRTAVASFIERTQPQVWRLCAHLGGRGVADDLTQETYLRAIRALPDYRGDASARTWLLTIARRTAADSVRRTVRRRRLVDTLSSRPTLAAPAPALPLDPLLASLDPVQCEAFALTQLLGLTYLEAAAVCDCPVGTIRSRVARARETLLAELAEEAAL
jgi:RNA polymerase sigma-70 factor, ECF subfamily